VLGGIALMAASDAVPSSSDTRPDLNGAQAEQQQLPSGATAAHGRSGGVAVAIMSSLTFAIYKVLFKQIVGDVSSTTETMRVLGNMGLWCALHRTTQHSAQRTATAASHSVPQTHTPGSLFA
jgi:hypothetical protein